KRSEENDPITESPIGISFDINGIPFDIFDPSIEPKVNIEDNIEEQLDPKISEEASFKQSVEISLVPNLDAEKVCVSNSTLHVDPIPFEEPILEPVKRVCHQNFELQHEDPKFIEG